MMSEKEREGSRFSSDSEKRVWASSTDRKRWWFLLFAHLFLVLVMGIVTFNLNNDYATNHAEDLSDAFAALNPFSGDPGQSNIEKIRQIDSFAELDIYEKLLNLEMDNVENLNSLAAHSFHVSLGAILGFLASTATGLLRRH